MRIIATLLLFISAAWFTGCSSFQGTTAYFHKDLLPPSEQTTVAVIPYTNQDRAMEWGSYKTMLEEQLENAGFEVGNRSNCNFVARMVYTIDQGGNTSNQAVPLYDSNGRVVGVNNQTRTVHQRSLTVRFFRKGASDQDTPIVEVRVLSAGSSSELARVMPVLTRQAFYRWPGEDGKVYSWTAYN